MAVQLPDVGTMTRNPLEPLSAEEIRRASEILREQRDLGSTVRFVTVALHEPSKQEVLEHDRTGGQAPDRGAFVVLYDRGHQQTVEAVVSLSSGMVTSWQVIEDVQPSVMLEEFFSTEEITRADPRWQEAMRKRGVTDFSLAMIDPWAAGYDIEDPQGRRLIRPLTFVRSREDDNGYARPVEGLIVLVDLDLMEVLDVRDHGVVPLPPTAGNYVPELMFDDDNRPAHGRLREDLRPIEITQPEGPSFTVDGTRSAGRSGGSGSASPRARAWCCTTVALRGPRSGAADPLPRRRCRRWSSPTATRRRRTGSRTSSTTASTASGCWSTPSTLGCDCLGEIHYFDAVADDQDGKPVTIKNAICMHEEDFGVLWKHTDLPHRARWRCAARAGWSSPPSPPSATTSTASSGTSTTTARSSSR